MQGFTLVDGIVLGLIALSAVLAYARGFVREVLSIAGWVVAAFAGFAFAPMIVPLVREIPKVGELLGTNCELGLLAGFAVAFAVALILVSFITPLIANAVQGSALGPIDQGLGFIFGIARGVLLVVIALVVYNTIFGGSGISQVDRSRSVAIFGNLEAGIRGMLPEDAPVWLEGRYKALTQSCPATADQAGVTIPGAASI